MKNEKLLILAKDQLNVEKQELVKKTADNGSVVVEGVTEVGKGVLSLLEGFSL